MCVVGHRQPVKRIPRLASKHGADSLITNTGANHMKKVMISSTSIDLPKHRREVVDACLREGVFPIGMENLPARDLPEHRKHGPHAGAMKWEDGMVGENS